jgi:hypothetical protein
MNAISENNTHVNSNPLSPKSNWAKGKGTFLSERMNSVDSLLQNNDVRTMSAMLTLGFSSVQFPYLSFYDKPLYN